MAPFGRSCGWFCRIDYLDVAFVKSIIYMLDVISMTDVGCYLDDWMPPFVAVPTYIPY